MLEDRALLSTVSWVGGSGSWDDPGNWSTGVVPGPNDDIVINRPGADVTVTILGGNRTIKSLQSEEAVVVTGATLSFVESSVLNSDCQVLNSQLIADGTAASLAVQGSTCSFSNVDLFAKNGGQLVFSGATSYAGSNSFATTNQIHAEGAGSRIDLSSLTKLDGGGGNSTDVTATGGGMVLLAGAISGGVTITADGTENTIELSRVTSLSFVQLTARNGGVLDFSGAETFTGVAGTGHPLSGSACPYTTRGDDAKHSSSRRGVPTRLALLHATCLGPTLRRRLP